MDIVTELSSKGIEVRQNSSNPDEINICCPFCVEMGESPDYKFRCGINLESGLGHCFNCGWSSRKAVYELIRVMGMAELVDQIKVQQFTGKTRTRPKNPKLPEGYVPLWEIEDWDPELARAAQYIRTRGIPESQIRKYEIGATPNTGMDGSQRIIFPIRLEGGTLAGWTGRDYTGYKSARYKNMEGTKDMFNARPDLYPTKLAILSEGIIKALAIERAISDRLCSIAVNGSSISDEQSLQLVKFQEIVVFGDPGGPGVRGMLGIAGSLTTVVARVSIAWPWPDKQADEMTGKEIRARLRSRIPYTPFKAISIRMELL